MRRMQSVCLLLAGFLVLPSVLADERPGILEEFGYLTKDDGYWETRDWKETRDGRRFRFGYSLQWYDQTETMAKMVISTVFEDGSSTTAWEGFKGWDPIKREMYYYGFSPAGRMAYGKVIQPDSKTWHTIYDGFGAKGNAVRIRDVFEILTADSFISNTQFWREGKWQTMMTETWYRAPRKESIK